MKPRLWPCYNVSAEQKLRSWACVPPERGQPLLREAMVWMSA